MDLLRLELATLWTLDSSGNLADIPTTPAMPVPMIALAGNPSGLIWAYGPTVPKKVQSRCNELLEATSLPGEVGWQPATRELLLGVLATVSPIGPPVCGPSYLIPPELDRTPPADVLTGGEHDRDTLSGLMPDDARLALRPPWAVAVRSGRAVAICETARDTPRSVEAGVRTESEFRRQGLGTAVTLAWSVLVKDRVAFYSTSWDNAASQGVARALGLTPMGQWWQVYTSAPADTSSALGDVASLADVRAL